MKNILYILLLLIGCSPKSEQSVQFRDLNKDFPTSEALKAEDMGSYELYNPQSILVKDSLLFVRETNSQENFGRCFNMNSGEMISTIVRKGRANNEMVNLDNFMLLGDSIQAISGNHPKCLKLYSINDIRNGSTINPREVYIPDTLYSFSFGMIDNNTIFGMQNGLDAANDAKYFIFDGKLTDVEKVRKELVKVNIEPDNADLRTALRPIFNRYGNKLVIATKSAVQFEILNLKENRTEYSRYYGTVEIEIKKEEWGVRAQTKTTDGIEAIGCNSDYIYFLVKELVNEKRNLFVLKFNWKLKPIAKYTIGDNNLQGVFDENCEYLYTVKDDINSETQTLTRYKL